MTSRLAYDPAFGYGVRSCRDGGEWEPVRDGEVILIARDLSAIRSCATVANDWSLILAEFESLMIDAEKGDLLFDGTNTKGDVCRGKCVEDVLEARLETTFGLDGGRRYIRLYFSEPKDSDRLLLALSVRHKAPGKIGLDEQDDHMREAQGLFNDWDRISVGP